MNEPDAPIIHRPRNASSITGRIDPPETRSSLHLQTDGQPERQGHPLSDLGQSRRGSLGQTHRSTESIGSPPA